jgi:hypothetical protein
MNEMHRLEKQKSQSGQALVEYILIVGLSVAIILGLMNQLYKPFGDWMKDYMGQYVECLLDVGELPTTGGGSESGECNSRFRSFSVADGRPPINANGSSQDKNNSQNRRSPPQASSSTNGDSSSSGAMANRARGRSGTTPFPVGSRAGSDSGLTSNNASNAIVEKLPESQYYKNRSSGSSPFVAGPMITRNGLNQSFVVSKKQNSSQVEQPEKLPLHEEVGQEPKSKKFVMKAPERKVASADDDKPWSFSEYFKYGLIILIIVAIVLFLLGQIAQISKSMEK